MHAQQTLTPAFCMPGFYTVSAVSPSPARSISRADGCCSAYRRGQHILVLNGDHLPELQGGAPHATERVRQALCIPLSDVPALHRVYITTDRAPSTMLCITVSVGLSASLSPQAVQDITELCDTDLF